jgi:uncharacterized protein
VERKIPIPRQGSRIRAIIVAVVVVGILSISTVVGFFTDFLWFKEVGFTQVFWKIFVSRIGLIVIFGLVFFVLAAVNLFIVGRSMPVYRLTTSTEDPLERFRASFAPYRRWFPIGVAAFLGLFFALRMGPEWRQFLLAANPVKFGSTDPLFGRDLSFYMFRLPALTLIYQWLFSALIVIALAVAGGYYLVGGIRPQAKFDKVSPNVKVHISVLIGLLALLRAWGYRLNQFELLYSSRGVVTGASYTDIKAHLPALTLLIAISLISAVLFLVNIRFRGWALPLVAVGLWVLTSVLAAGLFPFIVQRFQVEPAELQKERPYIQHNIQATRAAYGLNAMQVREFPAQPGLANELAGSGGKTLANVRLWDPNTLSTAYKQLQEIRTYYSFQDVDVDRYSIDGQERQLMLSLRELDVGGLESPTWQNDHLVFTHGYGAVASPTNEASVEGRPLLLLKDIPPTTQIDSLAINRGGIYYGEGPTTYSIVKTKQPELDYTALGRNKTTEYSGKGGVQLKGPIRRIAFAWRFRDVNLAISGLIDSDSRIMYNRQVRERLQKAAPFLEFDGDPYPIIADGKITWMLDGYTVSDMYPYSQSLNFADRTKLRGPGGGVPSIFGTNNYVRNSVKATIDAYDGTIKLYVWDSKDPIIRSWRKIFPSLFVDGSKMPDSLRKHIRYPEDLFRVQTFIYQRYHMINPSDFYQREDQWVIPAEPGRAQAISTGPAAGEIDPYYVLQRLPDAKTEDYVLILPMNPRNRPNMVSLLMAKSDPDEYGQLIDFRFPKGDQTFGVGQIHARINANEKISQTITLLNQSGSNVILGNLLVIPVGKSLLYTQPLFLQADSNAIPELKYVIVASSEGVAMEPTLEQAIQTLVGSAAPISQPGGPSQPPASNADLVKQALDKLNSAEDALRQGQWADYGRLIQDAKDTLSRAVSATPTPQPSASPNP